MKLTVFLIAILSLQVTANTKAQGISLTYRNAPLKTVITSLTEQTNYNFVFDDRYLSQAEPITVQLKNATITDALAQVFRNQPFTYEIFDNLIIIQPKGAEENKKSDPQQNTIKGKVIDSLGNPLQGVTVQIVGTSIRTNTDRNGQYELSGAPVGATLSFRLMSYEPFEVFIDRSEINVELKFQYSYLDETLVIGYGTTSRRLSTGNVSKISGEEVGRQPVANPLSAIQGRAAGVFVTNSNGLPGSEVTIRIRGQNSIAAGNDPLYIIDGVPYISESLNGTNVNYTSANGRISPFNTIPPSDIASIEILKDASATAIYGSRAANGVVLITTKKGQSGKLTLSANIYSGAGKVGNKVDMLSTEEYLDLRREAFANDKVAPTQEAAPDLLLWDPKAYTNWQDLLIGGTAGITEAQLSLSGGNPNIRFVLSGNFRKEGTVFPDQSAYNRAGYRLNVNFNSDNSEFSGNVNIGYSADDNKIGVGGFLSGFSLPPNYPLYDESGQLYWFLGITNPLAAVLQRSKQNTQTLIANSNLNLALSDRLRVSTSLGFTTTGFDQSLTFPRSSQDPYNSELISYSRFGQFNNKSFIIEPQLNYATQLGNGQLELLAGGTYQNSTRQGINFQGDNYSNEGLMETLAGAAKVSFSSVTDLEYRYISAFSRLTQITH